MPIEILSEHTIAQIAAGEVVERPASVVKELLDNAVDAGARNIHIAVQQGGKRLILVSDDGYGIPAHEVELAFMRHATSKLRTIDDLSRLDTLGFRGEALSSIAAVSRLEIVTRHRQEETGTRVRIEGSRLQDKQPAGAPAGTVVSVENLFYNTPARLKFMKKEATEKKHITTLVIRYAMAYPHVRFILEQDGREVFRSSGSGNLADVLVHAMGLEGFKDMVEIDSIDTGRDDRPTVKVSGYTSLPSLNRAERSQISIFVNGRWIQDTSLTYAVVQAYHALMSGGRYPVAVLMIEIAPQEVDVNVHPTKAEVRFRHQKAVFSAVQRAVREAVMAGVEPGYRQRMATALRDEYGPGWGDDHRGGQLDLELQSDDYGHAQRDVSTAEADPTAIPEGPRGPLKPRTLPMLRVVGQVGARYIVAEGPAGLYLVDQHGAHARILYESLREELDANGRVDAREIPPQTVELSRDEIALVEPRLSLLEQCGVLMEPFGPATYMLRTLPDTTASMDQMEFISGLINDLLGHPRLSDEAFVDLVFKRISSTAAFKAGQVLNQEDMQRIIRQLERSRTPREDPSGRPTLLHFSGDQLAREFGY